MFVSDWLQLLEFVSKVGDLLLIQLELVFILKEDSLQLVHLRRQISLFVVHLGNCLMRLLELRFELVHLRSAVSLLGL